ncbi:transposon Ty3-I Gag-Pol polyprotein [Trichonephila clavata]|uniref:Transposon Ty3-I Gag-Pol polyprotein n=1 Tax=Trichonephila clavata TaxID=2740835 RepID=A0A8X6KE87_TRICU|nr:transposon Ty3-I Gag-Pol polyprotein [Trichonephila clavata]
MTFNSSDSEEQHKTHLKLVFDRLQKYGLRVNISKSTWGVTQLEFLGYLITPEGSKPLPEKVDVILSYKIRETIRELRTFIGLINFYRRYLKDTAKNQAILHEYLKGSKKNDKTKILWTEEAKENFEKFLMENSKPVEAVISDQLEMEGVFPPNCRNLLGENELIDGQNKQWNSISFSPQIINEFPFFSSVVDSTSLDVSHITDNLFRDQVMDLVKEYEPAKQPKQTDLRLNVILKDDIPVSQRSRRMPVCGTRNRPSTN